MGTYGFRDVQLASFKQQAGEEVDGGVQIASAILSLYRR